MSRSNLVLFCAVITVMPVFADSPVVVTADKDWIPMQEEADPVAGSAVDFSAVVPNEAPAGKFGRVIAHGAQFEFERRPGVSQRFYGVNLCFGANYLRPDESATLARRLARIGYNAIRIHHYESILAPDPDAPAALDPVRLGELDALMAACVSNGLYMTTDLFVSRKVSWRACGVDRPGLVGMDEYKELVRVSPAAYSNFLAFARALLTHVNPYTGRRWADEPALAWLAFVNENNPGNRGTRLYRDNPMAHAAWVRWLAAKKASTPGFQDVSEGDIPEDLDRCGTTGGAFALFTADLEQDFARRMKAFLRGELGCRALVTDLSCWKNPVANQLPRAAVYDYVDDHFYVDHPQFLEQPWRLPSRCENRNPLKYANEGMQGIVFRRLLDRPFTITEYNYTAPGRFRGAGGILLGAQAALQDWNGIWRFAWSHDPQGALEPKPLDYFNIAADPLSLAAERASICLYRRRDLASLTRTCAIVLPPTVVASNAGFQPRNEPSWPWLGWYARLGTLVADAAPPGTTWALTYPDAYRTPAPEMRTRIAGLPTGDGALVLDPTNGTFRILTDRTCGGFAEDGSFRTGPLSVDLGRTAATVWASSLDGLPLTRSRRILLTHLTDVQNDRITYADPERQTLLAWGRLPHLMRAGRADVSLRVAGKRIFFWTPHFTVYALSAGGRRLREVPSCCEQGVLRFTADNAAVPSAATYLYEIVRD